VYTNFTTPASENSLASMRMTRSPNVSGDPVVDTSVITIRYRPRAGSGAKPAARGHSRFAALAAVVLGSAFLAGCATTPGMPDRPTAVIVENHDCLAPNLGGWELPPAPGATDDSRPDAPSPGAVPAHFNPVAVYVCDLTGSVEDEEGIFSVTTEERLEGDLEPLIRAFAEPSDPAPPFLLCTADAEIVPELWLTDAAGRAMRPAWPRNACGKTKGGVREVLADLTVVEIVEHRGELLESRAALEAGCPSEETVPFGGAIAIAHPDPGAPSGSENVPMSPPSPGLVPGFEKADGARLCRYVGIPVPPGGDEPVLRDVDGNALPGFENMSTLQTGRFVSGKILPGEVIRDLLANVASAEPAGPCHEPLGSFAVIYPLRAGQLVGASLSAELDGCARLFGGGDGPRPLTADLRNALVD
jgi:hypothetical protein